MATSARRFAELLRSGIEAVARRESRRKGVVRDELGYVLGREGGSAIEYWAYGDGHLPKHQAEVVLMARELVKRGGLDLQWLMEFLASAGVPLAAALHDELFPQLPSFTHNLPSPTTPFVGRREELVWIAQRMHDPACRLLTLIGGLGFGKELPT